MSLQKFADDLDDCSMHMEYHDKPEEYYIHIVEKAGQALDERIYELKKGEDDYYEFINDFANYCVSYGKRKNNDFIIELGGKLDEFLQT